MALKHRIQFVKDYLAFKRAGGVINKILPIYSDYKEQAGSATGHYFHQDLLVASYIFQENPVRHIDIGSRVDGFVAHVAAFRSIEVIDVRVLENTGHPNIRYKQLDLMDETTVDASICDSLSCLHAIEHFGLGRYGDPINPKGHTIGFRNILKMLDAGGNLYVSVPIGCENKIMFNAHRVFRPDDILTWQSEVQIELVKFSFVDDAGKLHREVSIESVPDKISYGCGIYSFLKI
jgi:hypothetical protein